MIRVVIADDEQLARAELNYLLRTQSDVEVVGEARSGVEAGKLINEKRPDLVILDINMPGQSGLDLARRLLEQSPRKDFPQIIFATAYDQHAVHAFEVNAVDYLLKPIEKSRLQQSLQRVRERMQAGGGSADRVESALQGLVRSLQAKPGSGELTVQPPQSKLLIRSGSRMLLVNHRDLIYAVMAEGRLLLVARECEGESTFKSLEELQEALPTIGFWRAHRSHLVNIDHIREVVPWFKSTYQLRMDDRKSTVLPVSRMQTKRLKQLFNL